MTTTDHSLVSVICPFYNGGPWLEEAIESVIRQTYAHWEMILVDDGSEEEVSKIAKQYSSRFPDKIFYTEHKGHSNRGVTASRNRGISKSTGSLIAFLDSDDCWMPEKLQNQIALFSQFPDAAVLLEASEYWFSWEKPEKANVPVLVGAPPGLYEPPQLMYIMYPLGKGTAPCPSGIMMKRDALLRSGGFEESFTGPNQVYEDQAFLSKLYLKEKVLITDQINNRYRQRSGSLMESISRQRQYNKVRSYFLDWLDIYLEKNQINDRKLRKMISIARLKIKLPFLHKLARRTLRLYRSFKSRPE